MPDGNNVAKTIDACITNLQEVKKQWSHCVKGYIKIETQLLANISVKSGDVKLILDKLKPLVKKVTADRGLYKEHYDNILKNCTLGEMLTWAKVNGKRGKLERAIGNSKYYQKHKSDVYGEEMDSSKFFEHILEKFGKIKYKKIDKGDIDGESGFLISLMTAVFDSILKTYIGLVQSEDIDEKTRHKMDFCGIKGKDIEKYICKEAGIRKEDLHTVGELLDESKMIGRLNVKRKSVDDIKDAVPIRDLYSSFESHSKRTGDTINDDEIRDISSDCLGKLDTANETIQRVVDSLGAIIWR